jgi:hypothetical protein
MVVGPATAFTGQRQYAHGHHIRSFDYFSCGYSSGAVLRIALISQSEILDLRIVFPINGSFSATIFSYPGRSGIRYERGRLD